MDALCLTCLSNVGHGVSIPPAIADFLQNILHFKVALRKHHIHLVCFSCYKAICEMKRFYQQLQDVEHYLDQVVEKELNANIAEVSMVDKQADKSVASDKTAAELYESIGTELETGKASSEIVKELVAENSYRCDNCCRIFETTESFRRHVKWHISHANNTPKVQREKKFKCPICGKRFRTAAEQRAHDVTHTSLRPFECEICSKTFRQLSGLSVHRAVHFGKRVECPVCKKRFATKFELTRHSNVHRKKPAIQIVHDETDTETEVNGNGEVDRFNGANSICGKIYGNNETLNPNSNLTPPSFDDQTVLLEEIVKEVQRSSVEITYGANENFFPDGQPNVFLNSTETNEYVVYKDKL